MWFLSPHQPKIMIVKPLTLQDFVPIKILLQLQSCLSIGKSRSYVVLKPAPLICHIRLYNFILTIKN